MTTYSYAAVDSRGKGTKGTLQAASQNEALQRIKDMGFFPMKVTEAKSPLSPAGRLRRHAARLSLTSQAATSTAAKPRGRVKAGQLAVFTRQLATLLEAGMPLLRSLRLLQEQETGRQLRGVIAELAAIIEGGGTFSEALAQFPKVFDRLFVNMVKAGELSGSLESSLNRLADFMEKSGRIKAKVRSAMYYPATVLAIAMGVVAVMLLVLVPRLKAVLDGLNAGRPLPGFTRFVLGVSDLAKNNFLAALAAGVVLFITFRLSLRTAAGRRMFDRFKLRMPVLGPVFRKVAVARFTRTLGTLISSGVPILQALTIVKEAAGNVIVGQLAGRVRDNVEQGESIAGPLRGSGIFPAIVVGMVDVGEQTGALPDMLHKIADNYDNEVDNSVSAMTSLLEPLLLVFLGVVVGSIVIAMFMAIIGLDPNPSDNGVGSQ
jgi:type IV pilus assembly protein PilC